jgi:hypothetical protein
MPITLPPSQDTEALANAIQAATSTGQPLQLLAGTHLTRPGFNLFTPIGPNGLVMTGPKPGPFSPPALIKRSDHSIGINPPGKTDDNHGIFFVPSAPTQTEIASVQFRRHQPENGDPFEFGIIIRGDIRISDVIVDCNMGNQGVEHLPKDQIEHSAMLGFAGLRHPLPRTAGQPLQVVFVAFNSVTLDDIALTRGGFADDIQFGPRGFRPNIGLVRLNRIISESRVNHRRNTLGFSGMAQHVDIKDCRIDKLDLEPDDDWSSIPGPELSGPFQPSAWALDKVTANVMSFGAKGAVQTLRASNLDVTESFLVSFAAGSISGSRFAVRDNDRRFFGLRNVLFDECVWTLSPDARGIVRGLSLTSTLGRPFSATFRRNTFLTTNGVRARQLIDTGDHTSDPADHVTAHFEHCRYQTGFATPAFPGTHIARLIEQGDYTFLDADLAGLDPAQVILSPNAQASDDGTTILYHVP